MNSSSHPIDAGLPESHHAATRAVRLGPAAGRFVLAAGLVGVLAALVWSQGPSRYEAVASVALRPAAAGGEAREVPAVVPMRAEDAILTSPTSLDTLLDRMGEDGLVELAVPEGADAARRLVARFIEARGIGASWLWREPSRDRANLRRLLAAHLRSAASDAGATLTVTTWSRHPVFCARWANALVAIYMEHRVARSKALSTSAMFQAQTRVDIARLRARASQEAVLHYWDTSGLIWRLPVSVDENRVADLGQDLERARSALKEAHLRAVEEGEDRTAARPDDPGVAGSTLRPPTGRVEVSDDSPPRRTPKQQTDSWTRRADLIEGELAVAQDVLVRHRHDEMRLEALRRAAEIDSKILGEATAEADVSRAREAAIMPDAELMIPAETPDLPAFPDPNATIAASAALALVAGVAAAWRPWRWRSGPAERSARGRAAHSSAV